MANYKVHGYLEKLNDEDKVKKLLKPLLKKQLKLQKSLMMI